VTARVHRIAISGHRGLPAPTADQVDKAIRAALAEHAADVTGISCLADGADQIFARAVTDLRGKLEVIIPAAQYRAGLPAEAHPEYDRLLAQAAAVRRMPFTESTSQAHMEVAVVVLGVIALRNCEPEDIPDTLRALAASLAILIIRSAGLSVNAAASAPERGRPSAGLASAAS
jgi:hypothetical protein